jgi:uncharacterized protein (TIGR02145 family)
MNESQKLYSMKKHCLIFSFILLVLCPQLSAQTLKNIHRQNLPVLQIPINLIDKVETVDVAGQKYLHVIQFNGFVNQVPVSQIDSITHTEGSAMDPTQLGNLRTASVMGIVRGPTGAPEMNAIVRSPYGGEETRTDPNGVFFLNDIVVYDKLGYITITKPGFHQASRSFLPLETGSNRVNIQLLPMTQSGNFIASIGGTVTSGLLQLNFPANAIQLNGQAYSGTVSVFAQALDPSSTEMFDQMPGELLGGLNDSLRLLRSFGMASIELRDANMNELQLAEGLSATLIFNIPSSLQADAPETIDWWSFDETLGYWKHEGEAQKQGSQYIGLASHFSWWNCDVPQNFNDFQGSVITSGGSPIANAQINVVSPTLGNGITYTNTEGEFSCRVPKNQSLTLNIKLICSTTNTWVTAYSETIISGEVALSGSYTSELTNFYAITGTLLNCTGQLLQSGYVRIGLQNYLIQNGAFTIQTCATGFYSLRGYNSTNPDTIKVSELITVQVNSSEANAGDIQTCYTLFGSVTDIDGNTYETVLIGSQWWMAENLRTATYANGEPIPNVTDANTWLNLDTGAWCNYNNDLAFDSVYGKLYNCYTAVDARGLCPAGWHVPTDAEWTILTDYLGGIAVAGGKMKSTGTQYWSGSNTMATNESSFSGLPGGFRDGTNVVFNVVGSYGNWWSSTEYDTSDTWFRYLNYANGLAYRSSTNKRSGFSIRCVKD